MTVQYVEHEFTPRERERKRKREREREREWWWWWWCLERSMSEGVSLTEKNLSAENIQSKLNIHIE